MDTPSDSAGQLGHGSEFLALSPRLFRNPVLDRLSRVDHRAPLLVYLPAVAALLYLAVGTLSLAAVVGSFLAGYIIWTLVEYLGHRFLFHYQPATRIGRHIQFLIHGVHHDHPNDPLRLVMPPLMSLPIMAVAWATFRLLLGTGHMLPVLAGFISGYLIYDMLHFHLHHARPRTALGRMLRYRHMHHHFRDATSWFGVSAPWWDRVFGTQPVCVRK